MSGTQEKLCFTTQVINTFVTQIIAYNNVSDMRWHIPIEQALEVSRRGSSVNTKNAASRSKGKGRRTLTRRKVVDRK